MVTNFLLVFGIVMMISGVFSYKQMKATTDAYAELKKKGRLIVGEKRVLLFFISEVVAFAVGKDDRIKDAVKISGMLPFRKVKKNPLPYTGKRFTSLNPNQQGVDETTIKIVGNMIRKYAK